MISGLCAFFGVSCLWYRESDRGRNFPYPIMGNFQLILRGSTVLRLSEKLLAGVHGQLESSHNALIVV